MHSEKLNDPLRPMRLEPKRNKISARIVGAGQPTHSGISDGPAKRLDEVHAQDVCEGEGDRRTEPTPKVS
eukprot:3052214-Pyramimonas_sp.AAC.1